DPGDLGDDDLVAGPHAGGEEGQVEGGRARRQGDGVADAEVARHRRLEARVVEVRALVPGVSRGVGDGIDLAVGDPRTGHGNALLAHQHGAYGAAPGGSTEEGDACAPGRTRAGRRSGPVPRYAMRSAPGRP